LLWLLPAGAAAAAARAVRAEAGQRLHAASVLCTVTSTVTSIAVLSADVRWRRDGRGAAVPIRSVRQGSSSARAVMGAGPAFHHAFHPFVEISSRKTLEKHAFL